MKPTFENLKIVDFDAEGVSLGAHGLRRMPFKLSGAAPERWAAILRRRYNATPGASERDFGVAGDTIFIDCAPQELQAILDGLKPMVREANDEYRATLVPEYEERMRAEQEAKGESEDLEDLRKRLNFD